LNYDKDKERDDHQRIYNNLNNCQKIAFHAIVDCRYKSGKTYIC
jgi:hypothetical protein